MCMAIGVYGRVSLLRWLESMVAVAVVPISILANGFDHCISGFWYSSINDRTILQDFFILRGRGWPCGAAVALGYAEAARMVDTP